jgi:hypothetical protein
MSRVDEIAKEFSDAVRDAFVRVYGSPSNKEDFRSIYPSWSEDGIRTGWHDPDPRVVMVGTERAWVQDPWNSTEDHNNWDAVLEILRKAGWGNVGWDSINPAVHIVFWQLPAEWERILMKRAMERGQKP